MKPQDTPASSEGSTTRKAYEKPTLQVYGDLAEISKSLASQKKPDGAGHPNKHFTN